MNWSFTPFMSRALTYFHLSFLLLLFGCATPSNTPSIADVTQTVADDIDAATGDDVAPAEEGHTDADPGSSDDDGPQETVQSAKSDTHEAKPARFTETKIIRFEWSPIGTVHGSYSLSDAADQHRVVIPKGIEKGKAYPVVIAFHGQPKRGRDPRDYGFMPPVQQQVLQMVESGEIQPVILVMPVFRFSGTNWPKFNPGRFTEKVSELLGQEGITPADWYAFGHSGAAGCGGQGLNRIHVIAPKGVGFFDTCLGKEWRKEVKQLQKAGIETFNIHSVETAGFKPKQRPEYQADFDFGRAYSPLGIEPVDCPRVHPGKKLRPLPYRCSATEDGVIKSFVIDTGEGVEAHKAILEPAISFFLKNYFAVETND